MIYNIKIGDRDNCYIITGGIASFEEFNPVEVDGTQNSVVIHVDSQDDDIFTPWIKQSLEVQMLKTYDGQFDDIISGNDNETFGILVENGGLQLVGENIWLTEGATLKFIGTLTLETYIEQYKHVSPVSFIFHDRIGSIDDYDFATNEKFKSVPNLIACCVYPIICSSKLYLEWPYLIGGSDDPQNFRLELSDMDEKTCSEVLEIFLKDFGLQMYVDYSKNVQDLVKDSGAIVIRSVVENAETSSTYWELSLSSYIAAVCQRRYYTYTGSKGSAITKPIQRMNTDNIPLLDNATTFQLERVASAINAKNEVSIVDSILFRSKPDFNYSVGYNNDTIFYYCHYGTSAGESTHLDIKKVLDDRELSVGMFACTINGSDELYVRTSNVVETPRVYRPVFTAPAILHNDLFINGVCRVKLKVSGTHNKIGIGVRHYLSPHVIVKDIEFGTYSINVGDTFVDFDQDSRLTEGNSHQILLDSSFDKEYYIDIPIGSGVLGKVVLGCVAVLAADMVYYEGRTRLTNLSLTTEVLENEALPGKIELVTNLGGNNRKVIELDPTFKNAPNISGGLLNVKNIITPPSYKPVLTVGYKALDQTMLAHLSDQYGWQYNGNRWNMEGTIKGRAADLNIMGLFGIDGKRMMFLNGDYDARYRELNGKWGQVREIYEKLLDDSYEPLTWDDGTIIQLN